MRVHLGRDIWPIVHASSKVMLLDFELCKTLFSLFTLSRILRVDEGFYLNCIIKTMIGYDIRQCSRPVHIMS